MFSRLRGRLWYRLESLGLKLGVGVGGAREGNGDTEVGARASGTHSPSPQHPHLPPTSRTERNTSQTSSENKHSCF